MSLHAAVARVRLFKNVAIDVAAIVISLGLVKRDLDAQAGRLARMEIGAKLASLKVRLQVRDAGVGSGAMVQLYRICARVSFLMLRLDTRDSSDAFFLAHVLVIHEAERSRLESSRGYYGAPVLQTVVGFTVHRLSRRAVTHQSWCRLAREVCNFPNPFI